MILVEQNEKIHNFIKKPSCNNIIILNSKKIHMNIQSEYKIYYLISMHKATGATKNKQKEFKKNLNLPFN